MKSPRVSQRECAYSVQTAPDVREEAGFRRQLSHRVTTHLSKDHRAEFRPGIFGLYPKTAGFARSASLPVVQWCRNKSDQNPGSCEADAGGKGSAGIYNLQRILWRGEGFREKL